MDHNKCHMIPTDKYHHNNDEIIISLNLIRHVIIMRVLVVVALDRPIVSLTLTTPTIRIIWMGVMFINIQE